MSTARLALSTVPDENTAAKIARALITEKLAACVNIVPKVRSIYAWKDELCDETEVLCVIKTNDHRLDALRQRLVELHPYDVPEFVVLPIESGHEPYLNWITDTLA